MKDKAKKQSKPSKNTDNKVKKQRSPKRRKAIKTPIIINSIAMSTQLAKKMQSDRSGRSRNTGTRASRSKIKNVNNEPRLCGNGKPMPSFTELEKMFEDSDTDNEENVINTDIGLSVANVNVQSSNTSSCSTPKKTIPITDDKLKSPNTIKSIADKMLLYISNLPDGTILLDDDEPPPPVIPPKKRKKPDVPYIVGCKNRLQVQSKPSVNFCKGDDYGIDKSNSTEDDEIPKPRAKRTKTINTSKSIFNAKSDEIAAHLKEMDNPDMSINNDTQISPINCDRIRSFSRYDNPDTSVNYNTQMSPINCDRLRSFSPIPSTSRDSDVIHKNDILFNESFSGHLLNNTENDMEIIDQPSTSIIIEDSLGSNNNTPIIDSGLIIEIDDNTDQDVDIESMNQVVNEDHNDVEVIACSSTVAPHVDSPITVEEYYSSLDLNQVSNIDITDPINVDELIAENNALIEKYKSSNTLQTVTLVEPNQSTQSYNLDIPSNSDGTPSNYNDTVSTYNNTPSNCNDTPSNFNDTPSDYNYTKISNTNESTFQADVYEIPLLNTETSTDNGTNDESAINISDELLHTEIATSHQSTSIPTINPSEPPVSIEVESDNNTINIIDESHADISQTRQPHNDSTIIIVDDSSDNLNTSENPASTIPRPMTEFTGGTSNNGDIRRRIRHTESSRFENVNNLRLQMGLKKFSEQLEKDDNKPINYEAFFHTWMDILSRSDLYVKGKISSEPCNESPQNVSSNCLGDCPICMDSLSNKSMASTICGHVFCMKCIQAAMKSSGKRCPTCRKALRGVGYHQLFL